MKTAIYPGSFDPVTNGHLDIIQRASKMFDKLVVVVLINPLKTYSFSMKERCEFLKETTKDIPNVEIASFDGLLADYFNQRSDVDVIVKGLRATTDFEYEFQMAGMNQKLMPEVETIFLTPAEQFQFISGTFVREIAMMGGDVSGFVPQNILAALERKRLELKQTSL
jgi:pantetheine-phosphate adenylyltransferase